MSTSKRTRTTARCLNRGTRWRAATSSSGRRSITTRRNPRPGCLTLGFHLTTDWGITSKWNRTATGRTVRPRWGILWVRSRTGMDLMGTSRRRLRFIRRASYKRRRRRQAGCRAARRWSRLSRCHTTCTHSSTWCSMGCRHTSSTSCTQWTTCSTRRRCRRCTSSPCTHSNHPLSSPRQTPMRRCLVHSTHGCEVNLVSLHHLLLLLYCHRFARFDFVRDPG